MVQKMTTTKKTDKPLDDLQKQYIPLEGEVSPEKALHEALAIATKEKSKMKTIKK